MALGRQWLVKRSGQSDITALTNFDWPGFTWGIEETTAQDATSKITTRNQTVRTDGPATFVLNPFSASDTEHAAIRAANVDGSSLDIVFTAPNGDTYTGSCAVTQCKPNTPGTGNFAMAVTLTPLGEMVYAGA